MSFRRNSSCAARHRVYLSWWPMCSKAVVRCSFQKATHYTLHLRKQSHTYAMRGNPPPHPTQLGSSSTKHAPLSTVSAPNQGIFEASAYTHRFDGPILQMRHVRQSAAASHSAWVSNHPRHFPKDRGTHPWSLSSKLQTVNSCKEWHSPPCQACPALYCTSSVHGPCESKAERKRRP